MPARSFLAVELPDSSRALIAGACAEFRAVAPAWAGEKWVAPALLHITVKFIGALPDPSVIPLLEALREESARHAPLQLEVADIRAVPSLRRASMLWARVGGEIERCELLASGLEGVLEQMLGVARDTRTFRPHLTLVRAREHRAVAETTLEAVNTYLREPARAGGRAMSVPYVTLFSSTLGTAGPAYRELGSIPLAGR